MAIESYTSSLTSRIGIAIALLSLSLVASCCGTNKNSFAIPLRGEEGSVHYLIIGVGVVTVPGTEARTAVQATQMQSLGVAISDQPVTKLGVGYMSSTVVSVPDGAKDVRVEVSQVPGGPLRVETQNSLITDKPK